MAIFSKKSEDETVEQNSPAAAGTVVATASGVTVYAGSHNAGVVIVPRLSEKASSLARLNKYVFKVEGKINKVELRKAIEKAYDTKIAQVNIVTVKGKSRRYGKTEGKMSNFKKAIVTLKPGSKKIDIIEAS